MTSPVMGVSESRWLAHEWRVCLVSKSPHLLAAGEDSSGLLRKLPRESDMEEAREQCSRVLTQEPDSPGESIVLVVLDFDTVFLQSRCEVLSATRPFLCPLAP